MLRRVLPITLIASLVMPLAAQAPPPGLKMRVDRSTNAQDPDDNPQLKVAAAGKGFRVTGGPAGVFWDPANSASGNYTLRATFQLMKPSNHTNYYGLVFGGSALEGAAQAYTYFIVAQDGSFQIKQRSGEASPTVQGSTRHASIKTPDGSGQSVNVLEVRVAGDTVSYVVNNTVVHTTPKSAVKTDGLVGVRVNHLLDVTIEGFGMVKS
jgi:hypothetical protein